MIEVQRFREKVLTCSNGALSGLAQKVGDPVIPRAPTPRPAPGAMNEDAFLFLDKIPLEKRQFTGSLQAFGAQLKGFVQQAVAQSGLPPRDYESEAANVIDVVGQFSKLKINQDWARNRLARELDFAHVMVRDENGHLRYIKLFKRQDHPNERILEMTLGPPPGGWGIGHGFIVEVRFRRLADDPIFPIAEEMKHYGIVHANIDADATFKGEVPGPVQSPATSGGFQFLSAIPLDTRRLSAPGKN